jgi:hypothetical protein
MVLHQYYPVVLLTFATVSFLIKIHGVFNHLLVTTIHLLSVKGDSLKS